MTIKSNNRRRCGGGGSGICTDCAMLLLYVTFGCVLSVGFWAKPLIQNAIVRTKRYRALNASAQPSRA